MHAITKRLEICIDINIEIRKVDYYSWIFTSRIFRLVFFSYEWLTSYSHKAENIISEGVLIRAGGLENFLKKKRGDAY